MARINLNCKCENCGILFHRKPSHIAKQNFCNWTCRNAYDDLIGQSFNNLTVVESATGNGQQRQWKCLCKCGNFTVVSTRQLRSNGTKSCGCLHGENHGLSQTPEYFIWKHIIQRCTNPQATGFADYGERGITVCERWRHSFTNFISDMGNRPNSKLTIERIENEKGYSPENCRWATRKEQARNSRRNIWVTFRGETLCLQDWSEKLGIKHRTLHGRLKRWTVEKAMTAPLSKGRWHDEPKPI